MENKLPLSTANLLLSDSENSTFSAPTSNQITLISCPLSTLHSNPEKWTFPLSSTLKDASNPHTDMHLVCSHSETDKKLIPPSTLNYLNHHFKPFPAVLESKMLLYQLISHCSTGFNQFQSETVSISSPNAITKSRYLREEQKSAPLKLHNFRLSIHCLSQK